MYGGHPGYAHAGYGAPYNAGYGGWGAYPAQPFQPGMGNPNGNPWMGNGDGPAVAHQVPWGAPAPAPGGAGSLLPGQQGLGLRGPMGAPGGPPPGAPPQSAAGGGAARAAPGAEPEQARPSRPAAGFLHRRSDRNDAARRAESMVSATVVDARELFCAPGRAKRPKRLAVVLRGLPGSGAPPLSPDAKGQMVVLRAGWGYFVVHLGAVSLSIDLRKCNKGVRLTCAVAAGKTRIASRLRDAEVTAGGEPPRIHSIDDYFVTARPPPRANLLFLFLVYAILLTPFIA